jgi:hypothetical protein
MFTSNIGNYLRKTLVRFLNHLVKMPDLSRMDTDYKGFFRVRDIPVRSQVRIAPGELHSSPLRGTPR